MTSRTLIGLAAVAALAACSPKAATPPAAPVAAAPTPPMQPAPAADMSKMDMSPAATMAKGSGVVTAIDKAAGAITLQHGPIPEAKWPAMTMAFKASPAILGSAKVGDHVNFDLRLEAGAGEVTAITRQ
jgi:Cu(I)/Ag(I) efflux system protein CusF